MNPEVSFRYFGNSRFAPSTSPQYFQVPKQRGVFPIFCLGGSTTVEFPYYYNGSFSSFLFDRLKAIVSSGRVALGNDAWEGARGTAIEMKRMAAR